MTIQSVWSDEYKGERFTYYSPLRPVSPINLPLGTIYVTEVGRDPRIVVTTAPLPDSFIKQTSLEVAKSEPTEIDLVMEYIAVYDDQQPDARQGVKHD